ncbi:MAG: Riboflavin biosynthesis protein RibD [Candidatus Tokpelaia hoelldobleri]|uniref:Riboflavin biosynthesis protein RibD n=1 Tax=Candidatus Tokpelaia hoelldobleri TaxID=1902579 RepID=A0A1U9JUC4_9HYPH|nr:MAG: Riboflavin biosynthesis protein RibD [Candidatus Tokpelaia hoelldoblerii]
MAGLLPDDERFMAAAVRYGRWHLGQTAENPSVGALIVRDGVIVGRGVTAPGGRPHAEVIALQQAGDLARGATVYVTLEPCSHFGRTPPCADALVAAGAGRVVVAAGDPDPRVNGRGLERLRQADIEVVEQVQAVFAEEGLSAYLCRKQKQRPEVTLKLAVSADGCIGRMGEGNVVVSGTVSKAQSHIMRAEHDAILVGIGTVLADDPLLDCRLPGLEKRSPLRVVLDSKLQIPATSRLMTTAKKLPLRIYCNKKAAGQKSDPGGDIVPVANKGGRLDLQAVAGDLAQVGISSLLVEGGVKVAAAFYQAGLVDRMVIFHSPVIMGEQGYKAPDFVLEPAGYEKVREERFGEDCCVQWKRNG